jgi:Zn-dependent peptidase ImmA (M78 family)
MTAARVGSAGSGTTRLVKRLRALGPSWSISRREARWIAERQAKLLLTEAGITAPPVPEAVVTELAGVNVYPLTRMPAKGLLGASKPNGRGGDILIDSTLPLAERRVTLLHELKHIIDGGHTTKLRQLGSQTNGEGLCTDFALSVLMPAPWLRADWQAGHRSVSALAERYQVPAEAVAHRLHALGLLKRRPRHRGRSYCQWQPHTKNIKATTRGEGTDHKWVTKRKGGNNP